MSLQVGRALGLSASLFGLLGGASACTQGDLLMNQTVAAEQQTDRKAMRPTGLFEAGLEALPRAATDASASPTLVRAWLGNPTDTPAELLLWNTPVEPRLSADVFDVRLDGVAVDYLGRVIKRGTPLASDWITLEPGARREVEIDLAEVYDLSKPGQYTVDLAPTTVAGVAQFNQSTPVQVTTEPLLIDVRE